LTADLGLVSWQVKADPPVEWAWEAQKVVDYDDDGLRDLRTVDPGQGVDAVGGICGEVGIMQRIWLSSVSKLTYTLCQPGHTETKEGTKA